MNFSFSVFVLSVFFRLKDGAKDNEGRLEVRVDQFFVGWGTVCSNNFDDNDAKVACRSLNLR